MKALTAILHARVAEAEIRKTTAGRDYLSIKAELIDEAKAAKCGPVWVTSFHKSHIAAGMRLGMCIRVEGALDVQRYEKGGEKCVSLRLTADDLTIMVEAAESPSAAAQPATTAFEPKNKPKRSSAELAALAFPAEMNTGKRHERPFNDDLPF